MQLSDFSMLKRDCFNRTSKFLVAMCVAGTLAHVSVPPVEAAVLGPQVRANIRQFVSRAANPVPRPTEKGRSKSERGQKSIAERVRYKFPSWRKQELNKVLREVGKRGMGRGNKLLKEGIVAHEGGHHKGHTISRHVAVSAKYLRARIEFEKNRNAEKKKKNGEKDARKDYRTLTMEHISSFKDIREADRFIDRTLTEKQNFSQLSNWAKKNNSKSDLTLTLRDAGTVTGLAVHPKTKKLVEARGVQVRLVRDSSRRGWSIVTAHPIVTN